MDHFKHFAGDMETLLLNTKTAHSLRVFGKHPKLRKNINISDIESGIETFISNRNNKKENTNHLSMYL